MEKPLVSILIPVFNRGALLKDAVYSAIGQTYKNIEIVIVDNCSTDDTWEVCKFFSDLDSRVRIFRNDSNIGPVRNWRRCIDESKGVFAKLLFSDDMLAPECIETSLSMITSEVGLVFSTANCGANPWTGDELYVFKKTTGVYLSSDFLIEALFGALTPVSPAAAFFRREDLVKNTMETVPSPSINNFRDHGAGPDLLIYLLTATQYGKVGFIRQPLVFFRAHGESITIKSNKNFLLNAYRQARIWFAENYLSPRALDMVYACEWKRYCRREHSWSLPSKVLSQFSFRVKTISLKEALVVRLFSSNSYNKRVVESLSYPENSICSEFKAN